MTLQKSPKSGGMSLQTGRASSSWTFDVGCSVQVEVSRALDRFGLYAFREGLTALAGPVWASSPDAGNFSVTAQFPDFCINGRIFIGAGFSAGHLVVVMAS